MAKFMNHIVDYRRNGPGVRKNAKKVYTMAEFWRIYRDKFFKLIGLNLMYFVCLLLVGLLCYLPMHRILDGDDYMVSKLSFYELNSEFKSMIANYIQSYKIEDTTVDQALPYVRNVLDRIQSVNADFLTEGMEGFDFSGYSEEDKEYLYQNMKSALSALGFSLENGEAEYSYIVSDSSGRQIALAELSEEGFEVSDSLPRSVYDLAKIVLCLLPVILLSPVNLAFFRVTRDYVRESPSFMFSDIWDTIKKNWWQSLVIGVLQYLMLSCVSISLLWYYSYINNGWFFKAGFILCLFLTYIVLSMSFYIGIMQVTLDMNLRKIIKNAFYFSVICLWKNLFMILVSLFLLIFVGVMIIIGMAYPQIVLPLTMIFIMIMLFSFWFYFISYMTYPSILKYIVDPYYENLKKEEQEKESEESDSEEDGAEAEPSEYVYHNGRMVHRSVLEQESLFNDEHTEQ